jgi:S1-C subfamily serine protease
MACGPESSRWTVWVTRGALYRWHVPGDLLDLILIGVIVAFAVSGYRQGFIIGALSLAGFLGGAAFGLVIAPALAQSMVKGQAQQSLIAIVVVFVAAMIGQFAASTVGAAMRDLVTWRSATIVDSAGGAAVSILSVLVIAWLIGTSVANAPFPTVVHQVNNSAVLRAVDKLMPEAARTWFSGFRRVVASGPFPQVFGGLGAEGIVSVPPPSAAVLSSSQVRAAGTSVVKVLGTAPDCSRRIEGSGFVFAANHVMTNAHVVAGVQDGPDVYTTSGRRLRARVVLYDYQRDVAVLYVPGLNLTPLKFDGVARTGDSAVVAGYPRDEPYTPVPARIGGIQEARGPNIYQSDQVTREIYAIRADVQPGNSGGPLLGQDGHVFGVVFAAAVGQQDYGYALTATEVAPDAQMAARVTGEVSTLGCD